VGDPCGQAAGRSRDRAVLRAQGPAGDPTPGGSSGGCEAVTRT
jgi:hypothetical protein